MISSSTRDAARAFVTFYAAELCALEPVQVPRAPCFGWGRGGVAYALFRAATVGPVPDRELLAKAARWTEAGVRATRGFRYPGWSKSSYSRGLSGLHAIAARIAHRAGDVRARASALDRYVAISGRARGSVELFQGAAGRLGGAAVLYRELGDARVRGVGEQLAERVCRALVERSAPMRGTGVAHGWPGVLLGLLTWERVVPTVPDRVLAGLVRSMSSCAATGGSWSSGHTGMALVYVRAYQRLGDRALLTLAMAAADHACAATERYHHNLLSGAGGLAYALLALASVDDDPAWPRRLDDVVGRILADVEAPDREPFGVWSGLSGLFCLAHDVLDGRAGEFPGVEA